MNTFKRNRRKFIKDSSKVAAAGLLLPSSNLFANFSSQKKEKLGFALVGLGNYSTGQLGPALKEAKNCYLSGIVTGTPSKIAKWSNEYSIPEKNVYNYENFDAIVDNDDIDVVYVVLPNDMHAEYTIRALEAGKHVICEKPMALNATEGRQMIDAAKKAKRKLAIGYRMHYDPYFIEVKRLGQEKILGSVNYLECTLAYYSNPKKGSWKLRKDMGGGSLYNLGVYPIQCARHTKGAEPIYLTAMGTTQRKELFKEVYESFSWQMEFADGALSNCYSSSSARTNRMFAGCSNGFIELDPATSYTGQRGRSSEGEFDYPQVFQQRLQIEDFARCVMEDEESIVSGEDGLKDMFIIDAIHKSIASGDRAKIETI
ncbi:MAG: Gfo/Idh/MocA family oxidoreductase [Cyclobacteriaceae bacterium]